MLAQKKLSKKKIIIYAVIITLMIAGNLFIYYRNSRPSQIAFEPAGLILDLEQSEEGSILDQQAERNRAVLEHNLFIALKKIGDWPVVPKNVGKADPFAPVFGQ